ncbi:MAG: hypothetical protein HN675_11575 [Opitutae bacterium]|nr:hypothetical protein [Opitutae bacterium]
MKKIFSIVLWAMAVSFVSIEAKETFHWATEHGWFGERITVPTAFAPDMSWKGIEEIRFAPGMFKPLKPDFFSYAFVFSLEPESDLSAKRIQEQILIYYKGLSSQVSKGKGRKVDVSKFFMELVPEKKLNIIPAQADKSSSYIGTLHWVEPFATGRAQTLRFEIQAWKNDDRNRAYVFVCVSPQKTDAPIWKKLRGIGRKFRVSNDE